VAVKVDGEKLREARDSAFLTQRELSERSGVSMDSITRLETGHGNAYGRTVRRLAAALGVPYESLLEESPKGKVLAR
jgi:transcriptional regulator with XRE-family HTH domain